MMTVQILRQQFTVAGYQRMIESGILGEADQVALIDGEIRKMSPSILFTPLMSNT
jgi:hypothetical protein